MKLILLIILSCFSMVALAQQEPSSRTSEISDYREELEIRMEKSPFNGEEHAAIKRYFSEINSLNKDLANSRRYLKSFNTYIRKVGPETFCTETLLEKGKWSELVIKCTKNSFFLCSEDVKLFPSMKEKLSKLMDEDVQTELAKEDACL